MEKTKNCWVIPTDKASRLLYNSTLKSFCIQKEIDGMFINDGKVSGANFWGLEKALNNGFQPHNIYITSNEEIKVGDWFYVKTPNIYGGNVAAKCLGFGENCWSEHILTDVADEKGYHPSHCVKIILTTDQDLIKDGVQSIDDEFLEWFVKNSSCERVEIRYTVDFNSKAVIIIPKEEPKQVTLEEVELAILFHNTYERLAPSFGYETRVDTKSFDTTTPNGKLMIAVSKEIIKWQTERMYSEEDLKEAFKQSRRTNIFEIGMPLVFDNFEDWFKQYKK